MPVSPKSGRANEDEQIRIGWQMAGLGFEVATMVIGAAALGWLFDRWRGTAPNGILIASLVGIVVALTTLVRGTLRLNRRLEALSPTRGTPTRDANDELPAVAAEIQPQLDETADLRFHRRTAIDVEIEQPVRGEAADAGRPARTGGPHHPRTRPD